jgi:protein CWC15
MTTAHRPTWKAAVGQGSDNGGWSAGGAVSHLRSVLDAPAHTQLKVRRSSLLDPSGDAEEQDDGDKNNHHRNHRSARLRASLQAILAAEQQTSKASIQERIGKRQIDPAIEERAQQKLLTNTAEIDMERIKAKYDDSDIEDNDEDDDDEKGNKKEESDLDDDDDDDDGDSGSDDDDDEEDDEAALQAELAKIRAEREAAKQKAEAEETAEQEEAAAVLGNPLLSKGATATATASGKLKRRWNDDVVFRNQAAKVGTTSAPPKRFNNDTVRNDFHKRFLNKFIR